MTKANQTKAIAVVAATILALCLLVLIGVQPADAAYPGENGKIVFWSDRSTGPGLYTIPVGDTATKIPDTSSGDNHAVWSPDSSRIAFQSTSATSKEISVMNANGSGRRELTRTPDIAEQEPTWSPDGTRIAFAADNSRTDATNDLEIWVMNADGSGLTQLTNNDAGERDTQPAWSPLGNRIAFLNEGDPDNKDGNSNIYVMDTNPTTDDAANLTPNDFSTNPVYQYNDEDPSWSPDGNHITYSTVQDVWKMDADGTDRTNLTASTGGGRHPAWSPNGNSIVYTRSGDIYSMDANSGSTTPIDTTLRKDEKPDWQPIPQCTITGTSRDDTGTNALNGTAGSDVICGLGGNDTIRGFGSNDIVRGDAGNDQIIGGPGNDTINGGPGRDTALYSGSTRVIASLATQFAKGVGLDVLLGIESLTGSSANDQLRGSSVANVLVGGKGADSLFGLGGADTLNSKDAINRNDSLDGGPGTDKCTTDAREKSIENCP